MRIKLKGVFSQRLNFGGVRKCQTMVLGGSVQEELGLVGARKEEIIPLAGGKQDIVHITGVARFLGVLVGTRISPPLDLSPAKRAGKSLISWTAYVPDDTFLDVHTSLDNGVTWLPAVNGGPIPGLEVGDGVVGKTLLVRQTLKSLNPEVSPILYDLSVELDTYYKRSDD